MVEDVTQHTFTMRRDKSQKDVLHRCGEQETRTESVMPSEIIYRLSRLLVYHIQQNGNTY